VGEQIDLNPLVQIYMFKLYDTLAFISGRAVDNDCLMHVYNLSDGKRVFSFGEPGRGPVEFAGLPLRIQIIKGKGELIVTDPNGRQSIIFNIAQLVETHEAIPIRKISLSGLIGPVISLIDERYYLCDPPLGGKMEKLSESPEMLMLHNISDFEKAAFVRYPSKSLVGESLVFNSHFDYAFNQSVAVSPDGKKILVVYYYMDMIEIYDDRLNLIKRLQGPEQFLPAFEESGDGFNIVQKENNREAFGQPIAGDTEFWVHYSGVSTRARLSSYPKIYAFNWEGELLRSFQSDSLPILVDIDFKNRTAYGVVKYGELQRFEY